MNLCAVCLAPLTVDDIGEECWACYEEWCRKREQRATEWWEEGDHA